MKNPFHRSSQLAVLLVAGTSFLSQPRSVWGQGDLIPPGPPGPTMKTLQQVEPRTPIDALNTPGNGSNEYIISAPGSYYLADNLSVIKSGGILVNAEGVTVDLNGFEVRRVANAGGVGINLNANRCVVKNGLVKGFHTGIRGLTAMKTRLEDLTVTDMTGDGINVSAQAHVENCLIDNVDGAGIIVGIVSMVRNCTVRTTGSHGISAMETSIIEGNVLNNNVGDSIYARNRCNIRNNVCDFPPSSGAGIHLVSDQGESRVENNNIMRRAVGIQIDGPDNYVANNTVRANGDNYVFAPNNFLNILLCEIPETIDWPASVKLAGTLRLSRSTNGIEVTSTDVTIDLDGHALVGRPGSIHGIWVNSPSTHYGLTVRNGTIMDWGGSGIHGPFVFEGLFEDLHAKNNGAIGLSVGSYNVIRDCLVADNGSIGIYAGSSSTIESCVARSNGSHGIDVSGSSIVRGCSAQSNGGTGINGSASMLVESCTSTYNKMNGFYLDEGSTIVNSAARNNTSTGIHVTGHCLVENCTSSYNEDGITAARESTIQNSVAMRNDNDGIQVGNLCFVTRNNCTFNGRDSVDGAGIHVTSSENRIDDNHVARNDRGILIDDTALDRNWVVRNTARDNSSLNYVIPAGNRVGSITVAPVSGPISGDIDPDALGAGTLDPWTNFSY